MIAIRMRTFGMTWHAAVWEAVRPSETLLLRLYNLIDGISPVDFRRKRSGGGDREPEPDGEHDADPWNDPALWMLMMH